MTDMVFKAGFEDVFGIIIFLVVIGRIISSIKSAASAPGKPAAPKAEMDPDLERLFKALTGQPMPEEVKSAPAPQPPPPPPVPVAKVKAKPAAPASAPVAAPPPKRAQRVERIQPVKPLRSVQDLVRPSRNWGNVSFNLGGAGSPAGKSAATRAARAEIMQMLQDGNSVRKAVLLREILGPPVSMRS